MTRPLAREGIDELEAMFAKSKLGRATLKSLVFELEFRTTPRAAALLEKVQRNIKILEKVRAINVSAIPPEPLPTKPLEVESAAPPVASPQPKTTQPELFKTVPIVASPEQAFQILKVPASASWEQVEQSRRELVAKAQPDRVAGFSLEKRQAVQDESRLVNAAYKLLLQRKG